MKATSFAIGIIMILALHAPAFAQRTTSSEKEREHLASLEQRRDNEENESLIVEEKHRRSVWYSAMQQKKPNYFKVKKLFENYFAQHPTEESKPKELCASWLKTSIFYLDKKNRVVAPPKINYNKIHSAGPGVLAAVTDSMAGDWHMLGPRNAFQTGYSGVGNRGGYVSCARIDPTNPNKLFVGFTTGGLWVSADGGSIWQLTDANLPDKEYIDIDVCKANSLYVYAISKNGAVIKSTDGGLSWSSTSLNATNYPGNAYDIAVSPANQNIVVARWGTNLYRTTDGGTTWSVVLSGLKNYSVWGGTNVSAEMLDFHATDANVVYHLDRNDNQNYITLYRSSDGGATFTNLGNINIPAGTTDTIVGWAKILTATNNPSVVYVAMGTGSSAYGHHEVHLFKLDAATGSILQTRVNMVSGDPGVHHGDVAMDLNNDNNIIYGSYAEGKAHYSTDNGATFTNSSTNVHSDLRALSMVSGKVLLGTDGEAVYSSDNGTTFTNLSAAISNHELWGFGAAFKSDVLGAGCNHGPLMIREHEGPQGWYNAMGADEGNSDVNPLDDKYLYSQGYNTYHVVRTGTHAMSSGDGGQEIDPGGIYSYFNTMHWHPNLYYTFITHHAGGYPSGNSNLATWKKSLIRSDNNGVTINKIIKTFTTDVFREDICMTNPNAMYVAEGLSNNKLWKTTDGGVNWTEITPSTTITGTGIRNISDIAVSDANPNEIWVSYSGVQNTCQVLHSTDGGVTYTNLTTSVLTNFPVTKIIFQRGTNGGIYIGNKSGVFYRNNTMANWIKLGNGLPMVDVRFIFINYYKGKLLIGTSRGAWDHDLYEHSNPMAQISADKDTVRCAIDSVQFRDYSVVKSGPSVSYSWSFPGGSPASSTAENPKVSYGTPGTYNVALTVTDQYGSNTQTLTGFIKVMSSECSIDTVAGKSLSLPASTDKASITSLPLNTNALTITAWVKPSGIQSDYTGIITHGSRTGLFVKNGSNELGYMWGDNQWGWNSGLTLAANQWSHIAWVVTPTNTTVYVNGIAATNNVANNVMNLSTSPWSVGEDIGYGSGRNFNGEVEELCVYNRSLSLNEVREKMHLTRPAAEPGLIGYYQFNESVAGNFYNKVSGGTVMTNSGGVQVVSTAPVASGVSVRTSITTQGTFDFGAAEAVLTFTKNNGGANNSKYPNGDVIVYKLNSQPSGLPTASLNYCDRYWIIRSFGTNATINTLQTLSYRQTGFNSSGNSLFRRNANDFGTTWSNAVSTSTTSSSSGNGGTQVFNNLKSIITTFGQNTLGSTSLPSFKSSDVIADVTTHGDGTLKISPNPVTNTLRVVYEPGQNSGEVLLEIETMSGRTITSRKINARTFSESIDVSGLSSGTYVLKVGSRILKFVKQ